MATAMNRMEHAITRFDAENARDPRLEIEGDGNEYPRELLYHQRLSRWVKKLRPAAPEHLTLAARCQHIRRWEIPRGDYPTGKKGYFQWRTTLYKHHADIAEKILREVGYDDATISRVRDLLLKKDIKDDPDSQTLEDAVCLTFIENGFAEFAARHDEEKLIGILQKTWAKMSDQGHAAALALEMPGELRALVEKALG